MRSVALAAVAAVLTVPAGVRAGWSDAGQGDPAVRHHSLAAMGAQAPAQMSVQLADGRLCVAADGLFVFDGATWRRHAMGGDGRLVYALSPAGEGRLLAGGVGDLGFFTEQADGAFVFTSLREQVPAAQRDFNIVWGGAPVGDGLVFVAQHRVLRWDGVKFTAWEFPGKARLFPVRLGEELWFTHEETGLYRMTPEGPHLEAPPPALPQWPAMGLAREARGLLVVTRAGFFAVGRPDEPLAPPETRAFLGRAALASVLRLPDGGWLLATVQGLGVVAADGRLLRVLDQKAGLPGNTIYHLLADQEGQVWATLSDQGVMRLDPSGAASSFTRWEPEGRNTGVNGFTRTEDGLLAATDRGLFHLVSGADRAGRFEPVGSDAERVLALAPYGRRWLVSRFGRVDILTEGRSDPVIGQKSLFVSQIAPSGHDPDTVYLREGTSLARVRHDPAGGAAWRHEPLLPASTVAGYFLEDAQGALWLESPTDGLLRHDPAPATGGTRGIPWAAGSGPVLLAGRHGDTLYCLAGSQVFRVATAHPDESELVAALPGVRPLKAVLSSDGRTLYVVFDREAVGGARVHGVGGLALAGGEPAAAWTERVVENLAVVGVPRALLAVREGEADTLWLGGTEGALRLRPGELAPARAPEPPRLRVRTAEPAAFAGPAGVVLPYAAQRLTIRAWPWEIDHRETRWLETRLAGRADAAWSAPTAAGEFPFGNLLEGDYEFEARVVDAAGRASAVATQRFRILPPWFRSSAAYAGYALALGLAFVGTLRLRETRIRRRNAELERTVAARTVELVKANAAKDEFLASISHEIRNPLNGVVGLAASINPRVLPAEVRPGFEAIRHCADHLSALLEDVLDFSKLHAGAVTLHPRPFDLPQLLASIVAITSVESARAGIPVEVGLAGSVPQWVLGDAVRIRQIVLNFVVNALRYAGRGTVYVTAWARQVRPGAATVTIAVADEGPGLGAAEVARLFQRFERGAAARETRAAGSGLGLALAKNLAELMGGRVWVRSAPGEGASFHFSVDLPLAERPASEPLPLAPGAAPLRALVVDDQEYNRLALATLLELFGFRAVTASEAEAALALARTAPPDAIFLDHDLPGRDGPALARALRALPELPPDLPIIATTAFTTAEKREQCLAAGMNAVMTKPITPEKIRAALLEAAARWRGAAPLQVQPLAAADPLARLRVVAQARTVPLADELARLLADLEQEFALLADAVAARAGEVARHRAHRLVGCLAWVSARPEEAMVLGLEAAAQTEQWERADTELARFRAALPGLLARLRSADSAAPAA